MNDEQRAEEQDLAAIQDQERDMPAKDQGPAGQADQLDALPEPQDQDPEPTDLEMLITRLEDAGDEAHKVQVYRIRRRDGKKVYLSSYPADFFDLDALQEDYGGGKFQCRVVGDRGRRMFSQNVEIGGPEKEPEKPNQKSVPDLVQESLREIRETIDDLRNPPRGAQEQNPLETSLALLTAFQNLQAPHTELLMSLVKESRQTGPGPGEMMEAFLEGMQAARDMGGEGDPMASVFRQLGPALGMALQGQNPDQLRQLVAPKQNPAHDPPQGEAGPDAQGPRPPRPEWDVALAPFVPALQGWAARAKDPDFCAEFVVPDIPTRWLPLLEAQLERGDAFLVEFFALHPEARNHQEWYRAFWDSVAFFLSGPEVEGEEDGDGDGEDHDLVGEERGSEDTGHDD